VTSFSRDAVEERSRRALEEAYSRAVAALDPARRVFENGEPRRMSRYHFQELQRKLKIFRWLDRLQFESFIDVGSGFDVYPSLVRARYGVPAYFSDLVHVHNVPYGGSANARLDHAVTLNIGSLPFADGAFDVVLASEVFEHLVHPVEAIAELLRITRRYLIITTLEGLSAGRWWRFLSHHRVDVRTPHVERNFLLRDEFVALFGGRARYENLLYNPNSPADPFLPEDVQQAAYASLTDVSSLVAALCHAIAISNHRSGAMGIMIVAPIGASLEPPRAEDDPALARWLIEQAALAEERGLALLHDVAHWKVEPVDPARPVAPALLARLRCPDCGAGLATHGSGVRCSGCGVTFAVDYGVPILYPTRGAAAEPSEEECLRRVCGDDPRRQAIVRRLMLRLRRNERPAGALRRWAWGIEARFLTVPGA